MCAPKMFAEPSLNLPKMPKFSGIQTFNSKFSFRTNTVLKAFNNDVGTDSILLGAPSKDFSKYQNLTQT